MTGSDNVHRRTILAAGLAFGALGARPGAAQRAQVIGVSMPTKASARWIDDGNNLVRVLRERGYAPDLQYADDEIPNQLSQIENMVTKGAKVLVIAAIDGTTLTDVLRQAPLFSALDDEATAALRSSLGTVKLRRGEVLFHEGDSGDKLYIVTEGKVKLGRTSSDGRENLLAIQGPGQMFGELSLFDPGPRSATVTAVTDAVFSSLSHEDLLRWLDGRPAVARGLLAQLAGRLRRANDVVADLVFSDVPGRVAKALLDLADRFGRTADDGVHVHHDLTQEELAQLVGASRETVNKALADFASRGWLRLEPRSVVIMDLERLSRRAR